MSTLSSHLETEIKSWLTTILKNEKLKNFSFNILGNSEKSDGHLGDIVFVTVSGTPGENLTKKYNLVLKCSKRNKTFRATSPVQEAFLNEIFIYEQVLPAFTKFQKEQGVEDSFESVPKYFGSFIGEDIEVIALENLKSLGYELWPKKLPLTRKHTNLLVTEYGKLHATSVALQQQRPKEFQQFVEGRSDTFQQFIERGDMEALFGVPLDESYYLLKEELDGEALKKWKSFRGQIDYVLTDIIENHAGLKVILHGDCWTNNFMHLHKDNNPQKVAFLDWQVSRYASPILDLSYFLFTCISEEDLKEMDDILAVYYKSFINHLIRFQTKNPETLYSFDQFLNDWKSFSRFGIMLAALMLKIASLDNDEVVDEAQLEESGKDFSHRFSGEIRDKDTYKKRMKPVVEYAAKHDLI